MVKEQKGRWLFAIIVLIVLAGFSLLLASCISLFSIPSEPSADSSANVARIYLSGEISSSSSSSLFAESSLSSNDIVDLLKQADKAQNIKAILIVINSPGGEAVASEDIVRELNRINKTKVSLIKDVGASGAYWVASATDKIVADPISITGSIGVLSSYVEISGLMQKYGIGYERINGGIYKDLGSPFRNLSKEEISLMQKKVDIVHTFFIEDVARNRKMDVNYVRNLSTGIFYIGSEAKDLGLVDELGSYEEAEAQIKSISGLSEIRYSDFTKKRGFFDRLSGVISQSSFHVGEGIGATLLKSSEKQMELK